MNDHKRSAHSLTSFSMGLKEIALKAFDDMRLFNFWKIECAGIISRTALENPTRLKDIVLLDENMANIETVDGHRTFGYYKNNEIEEAIAPVIMLLVWKWSPHFACDEMEGTNDFNSLRACVVCGKTQHGVRTGQHIGGVKLGFDPSPVREVIAYPHEHCFNPNCFSHEIERMIDPGYVFTPPKPGEDLGSDLARVLRDLKKDPAVQRFIKDMS